MIVGVHATSLGLRVIGVILLLLLLSGCLATVCGRCHRVPLPLCTAEVSAK